MSFAGSVCRRAETAAKVSFDSASRVLGLGALAGLSLVDADVAVLDTGIDPTHPDLNVVGGVDCTGTGSWADDHGHGTHVAGTIGALDNGIGVVGVAPGTRLWAVKVLDHTGYGTWSQMACGLDWVVGKVQAGVGIDAVSALDVWAFEFPGFTGLGLERGSAPHTGYTANGYADNGGSYTFHFPDGNASIARLLVRDLIPQSVPGNSAEDVVTARIDYARLDRPASPVRIRLGSTVVRARSVPRRCASFFHCGPVIHASGTKPHSACASSSARTRACSRVRVSPGSSVIS